MLESSVFPYSLETVNGNEKTLSHRVLDLEKILISEDFSVIGNRGNIKEGVQQEGAAHILTLASALNPKP